MALTPGPPTPGPLPPNPGAGPTIHVQIDQLVLHGFAPDDRHGIAQALVAELAEGLADWRPASGGRVEHLDGGSVEVGAGAGARGVGRSVAGLVREALR